MAVLMVAATVVLLILAAVFLLCARRTATKQIVRDSKATRDSTRDSSTMQEVNAAEESLPRSHIIQHMLSSRMCPPLPLSEPGEGASAPPLSSSRKDERDELRQTGRSGVTREHPGRESMHEGSPTKYETSPSTRCVNQNARALATQLSVQRTASAVCTATPAEALGVLREEEPEEAAQRPQLPRSFSMVGLDAEAVLGEAELAEAARESVADGSPSKRSPEEPRVEMGREMARLRDEVRTSLAEEMKRRSVIATDAWNGEGTSGNGSGYLFFPVGARVKVVKERDDGWWLGKYSGKKGWFPASYVEEDRASGVDLGGDGDTGGHLLVDARLAPLLSA